MFPDPLVSLLAAAAVVVVVVVVYILFQERQYDPKEKNHISARVLTCESFPDPVFPLVSLLAAAVVVVVVYIIRKEHQYSLKVMRREAPVCVLETRFHPHGCCDFRRPDDFHGRSCPSRRGASHACCPFSSGRLCWRPCPCWTRR